MRLAIARATLDSGNGSVSQNELHAICDMLKESPKIVSDAIGIICEQTRGKNVTTSYMALELLDKCMDTIGFEVQFYVMKLALKPILTLADPSTASHPQLQRKAEALIGKWAAAFAGDTRLPGFARAAAELSQQAARAADHPAVSVSHERLRAGQGQGQGRQVPATPAGAAAERHGGPKLPELMRHRRLSALPTSELVELAKTSQRAIMDQARAAAEPKQRRLLLVLHDQLAADLADYFARAEAAAAAAAATSSAFCL